MSDDQLTQSKDDDQHGGPPAGPRASSAPIRMRSGVGASLVVGSLHGQQGLSQSWRLAVLLSGSGRTLENLLAVIDRGELDGHIVGVVSSVAGVRGLDVAHRAGIPHQTLIRRDFPDNPAYSDAVFSMLAPWRPHLILLCGFLRQLVVPPAWEGRIVNIHPALLPQAAHYAAGRGRYGERVHRAVLDHGDAVSGATVHLVTNDYDEGPPLCQREVPVHPHDTPATLGARVFEAECALYPEAIRRYLDAHPELRTPPVSRAPAAAGRRDRRAG